MRDVCRTRTTSLSALGPLPVAACAGDNGRGFAVVADEVRSLAQRTRAATDAIGGIISQLRTVAEEAASRLRGSQLLIEKSAIVASQGIKGHYAR